uniref:Bm14811 n=1 Tax=Brugia malayi TaxID=6279 RepID=A0A0J9XZN8_BRUMA|nr:Bm14811 [Brugia malayi]
MIEDQNLSPITAGRLSVLRKMILFGSKNPAKPSSSRKSNIPLALNRNNGLNSFRRNTLPPIVETPQASRRKNWMKEFEI